MSGLFRVQQMQVGGFDHNFSYLITTPGGEAALVDPTGDVAMIRRALEAVPGVLPRYILLTHSHHDHTAGIPAAKKFFSAPVLAHPLAGYPNQKSLQDRERLPLGEGFVEVIFTPGHSSDSVCFRLSDDSGLFTGDTLFVGCCGYCEAESMFHTMQLLKTLPGSNVIYSGHDYGETPTATLAEEMMQNPFLSATTVAQFKERLKEL